MEPTNRALFPLLIPRRRDVIDLRSTEERLAEDYNPCAVVDLNEAHGRASTRSVRRQHAIQAADGMVCRWCREPEVAIAHAGAR